jgi:hypothetical protein
MKDQPITVEDYKEHSQEFFDKYFYVAKELGEGAKAEDILKIMESLAGVVMKKRSETKVGPFGFNKKVNEDGAPVIKTPEDAPSGTVAIYDNLNQQWGAYDL